MFYTLTGIDRNWDEIFEPQKNDYITEPSESRILGMFGDHGKYYRLYYRK